MMMHRRAVSITVLWLALLLVAVARAQEPAGHVATLEGRAEVQRAGQTTWTALAPGGDVFVGDRLRTADGARLKLLMSDDSVLTLGPRSELTIDEQVVRADGPSTSRMGQLVGSLRAVVTERYGTRGSSFEVKTPTAVAGVRGTGFVSLVDPDGKRTQVIGVYDVTHVRSAADPQGRAEVDVRSHEMTEITFGGLPTKPRLLSPSEFDALVGGTAPKGGPGEEPPAGADNQPEEGSGDPGDPVTPQVPLGRVLNRPDGVVDQPVDVFRANPPEPPPPPPRR